MPLIALTEAFGDHPPSASLRDIRAATEVARLVGCRIYALRPDAEAEPGEGDGGALAEVPPQPADTPGVWIGYIPPPERYQAVYEAALEKGIRLLNTPEEHLRAEEFDRAYPYLSELTPESVILSDVAACEPAAERLGLPVFVKGAVQSRKARGWKACVAETVEELRALSTALLDLPNRSRGRVVVRKLVRLRHTRTSPEGFPLGREYRVFLYRERVLAYGYYWEGEDPLRKLIPTEEKDMLALAREAARRLGVPYVTLDVGQTEAQEWIVVESGDAQFAGASQASRFQLWQALQALGGRAST